MGDISGLVQLLVGTLNQLVSAEVSLISGLKEDVNGIKNELESISAFLVNVEEREKEEGVQAWVKQLRLLAHNIEDVIERYQLFQKENVFGKIQHYLSFDVRDMASTIKELRQGTINIARRREFYSVTGNVGEHEQSLHELTTSTFWCPQNTDTEIIEDDIAKSEIIDLLLEPGAITSIIAVVGMRELGKTTVVASVYNDTRVRANFPLCAWVSIPSQSTQYVDVLRSMVMQFCGATNVQHTDPPSLQKQLRHHLKGKRYMVVFDNAREVNIKIGTYIKRWLPYNDGGRKIVVITRHPNVAYEWLDGSINGMYRLKPLPSEKAWELFCNKTFRSSRGVCPPQLNCLARGFLQKCAGFPTAIISVSRLLTTKGDDINEWKKVHEDIGFYLAPNRPLSGVQKTFIECYHNLPSYLKPCLLYFGLFPKEHPIARMKLIRLWIAEGFIRETRGSLTLEEVAEEYMGELINMSMIEVKSTDPSGKKLTLRVVNEFLHEMILSKLEELSFCEIISEKDRVANETSRRLSIHKNHNSSGSKFLERIIATGNSSIHSLFIIDFAPEITTKVLSKDFLKSISLLKVLDLFNAPIDVIPKEVGCLRNLRYLSLRCTRVSMLPCSIGKLENLQTLDLKQTFIFQLPKEFIQLRGLRHLLGYYYQYDFFADAHCMKVIGIKVPEGLIGNCLELQKLAFLDVNASRQTNWVTELKKLTQLRKLGIVGLKQSQGETLSSIIDGMKDLQALNVFSTTKSEIIDLRHVEYPPQMLKRLYLSGPLYSFPTWLNELHAIVKIRLRWSNLHDNPLETLQSLPNLVELQLLEAYVGEHLKISSNGFPKLKILHLLDLHSLKSLLILEGALPILEEMSIGKSKDLRVPSGINCLSSLTKLDFYDMPSQFTDLILPGQQYYSILKHVPSVLFHNKHSNGYWQTSTLR